MKHLRLIAAVALAACGKVPSSDIEMLHVCNAYSLYARQGSEDISIEVRRLAEQFTKEFTKPTEEECMHAKRRLLSSK